MDIIAKRRFPRTELILPTQYGKSMCVADGVLLRASHEKEKWAIVAPTEEKARIIMDYIIDRIFDDVLFTERLDFNGTKEKLKSERSKTRINFRDAGEIRVYSGNANNTKKTKSALMGFGAANIILDESGQIGDELYATVKRMLGGSQDNFLLEIGNPVYRNHFHRTWFGDRYVKIFRDVYMALDEGRYTTDFIDEMREEAGFDWMYECLFPESEELLPNGYRRLISDHIINDAYIETMPELRYKKNTDGSIKHSRYGTKVLDDRPMLGIDVAGGGSNKTKFLIRLPQHHLALVARTSDSDDLDEIADIAEELIREWNIGDFRTVIDAGGVGHGLPAIMNSRGYLVKGVLFGEKQLKNKSGDVYFKVPDAFLNVRAYMYWESRKWLRKEGGKLLRDPGFEEMKLINYRQNSSLRTQIEPKEDLVRRKKSDGENVLSPDTADAFVLTFIDTSAIVEDEDIYVG